MTNRLSLLLVFALGLGVARSAHGEQPPGSGTVKPVQVALEPFDLRGNATVEIADAISASLTALLKDDACFEVVSRTSPFVAYVVEGWIQAEPKRRIAALRIGNPKTADPFWSENYDYTNISGDMMARDVFQVLQSETRSYCHPEIARTIRAEYVGSADLPDGLAFYIMVSNLSAMNSEDREWAIGSVQEGMGLSPSESGQFLDDLLETLDSLKVDHDNITRELACAPSRPPLARAEIYPVFEAMDDAWPWGRVIWQSQRTNLDRRIPPDFKDGWESSKFSITHVTFRNKERWEQTGGNPYEALRAICDGLNARR